MPAVFLWPLVSGITGYFLGFFTADSLGWLKWLLIASLVFYVLTKSGVMS